MLADYLLTAATLHLSIPLAAGLAGIEAAEEGGLAELVAARAADRVYHILVANLPL
jgi:hypothetical protein